MSTKKFEFEALIIGSPDMDAAYIEFPYDVKEAFGTKGLVRVKVWFDGYLYRGAMISMGNPLHCVGITKKIRKAIGKNPGDKVYVIIEKDTEPRITEIPADVIEAYAGEPELIESLKSLSPSRQKEYIEYINAAKKQETRERRIVKLAERLIELGKKKGIL